MKLYIWAILLVALISCNKCNKDKKVIYEPKKDTTIYPIDTILDFFSKRYEK